MAVPWGLIMRSVHVWALCIAHFCVMWGLFIFISCLPMYYKQILNFDIGRVRFALFYMSVKHLYS